MGIEVTQARAQLGFDDEHGEDVQGVLVYGLWFDEVPDVHLDLPWADARQGRFELFGSDWRVLLFSVAVPEWPDADQWVAGIYRMLSSLTRAGARLSWCAMDGNFADPPDLFDPAVMGTQVYAAFSPSLGLALSCFLDDPITYLDPAVYARYGRLARDRSAASDASGSQTLADPGELEFPEG